MITLNYRQQAEIEIEAAKRRGLNRSLKRYRVIRMATGEVLAHNDNELMANHTAESMGGKPAGVEVIDAKAQSGH